MKRIFIIVLCMCGIIETSHSQSKYSYFITDQFDVPVMIQEKEEVQVICEKFSTIIDSLIPEIYACEANQEPYCFSIIISSIDSYFDSCESIVIQKSFFGDAAEEGTAYFYRDNILFVICGEIIDESFNDDGFHMYHRKTLSDRIFNRLFAKTGKCDFFRVYNTVPIMSWHPQGWHYFLINNKFIMCDAFGVCN